jgi:hypothetical protein
MSPVTTSSVARQIESLFDGASVAGLTDRQLIERFTARRDATGEAAFTAIVNRRGPMILDICTGKGGRFEVHSFDFETAVPVHFLEPKVTLGATDRFSGKSAPGGPVTVRLEPCGSARARFFSPEEQPIPGLPGSRVTRIRLVVSPGPYPGGKSEVASLVANVGYLEAVDPTNDEPGPESDAQGRITFPALIPGATYRVYDRTAAFEFRREFTVKAGETIDLGDILIEKPRS